MSDQDAPAWVRCPCCENFWCTIHEKHVQDCDCPEIEEWDESPYRTGGKPLEGAR